MAFPPPNIRVRLQVIPSVFGIETQHPSGVEWWTNGESRLATL